MKRMLFNATQAEELRVAIVDGQKLIDLDIESANKEQRKSNIYKAVITRLEPSLEAAFVDYGADRHGFLPFKEVSRAYFRSDMEPGRAKIQDALKVGQELIIQVEKDERGNKGAALTTFVSLAGRYLVLMPNNPRGGGVSRRVEGEDRQELREVLDQIVVPAGMSLIARTAAISRTVEELQWDMNYLLQLWTAIDGAAKAQSGAFLIYQESSLVIRAIRDYFQPDIGEILIDTDDIFEQAQQFMAHVMPGNVGRVKRYRDDVPLFSRFQIEHQIESAYSRQVNLPSGGAVVIDHTEALVAIDVNSGRATKGADIEETALRTNLEAADEVARQLRLRDLGGLIVIDFIDMESAKNQREVENRLRDALHFDRARVQMGKISRFGLLELSRQRLRPALAETSYITCPRCTGTGHIRSTESAALHILRILEEEAMKENTGAVHVQVPVDVGTFLLNEKRVDIARVELRHRINLIIVPNRHLETPQHEIIRLRHDQLNQEGMVLPSYQMGEKPVEETYQSPSTLVEQKTAKPEAAVKGITPEQPAPIVVPRTAAKPAATGGTGFIAKIFAWLRGEPAAPEVAPPPAGDKPARRERNERNGRDRDRNRNRRDNRENRDNRDAKDEHSATERNERNERGERGERNNGEQRRDRERNENRNPSPRREDAQETQPNRRNRNNERKEERETKPPKPPRGEKPAPAEIAVPTAAAEPSAIPNNPNADETTANSEGGNRRRRRGRGRGERREENGTVPAVEPMPLATAQPVGDSPADSIANPAPAVVIDTAVTPPPVIPAPATPAPLAEPAVTARPMPWPVPFTPAPAAVTAPTPPAVVEEAVAESIPTPPPPPAIIETAPAPAMAEPLPATAAPAVDIAENLQRAGLVMVETQGAGQAPVAQAPVAPRLGRKPKTPTVLTQEPLQMVETRRP